MNRWLLGAALALSCGRRALPETGLEVLVGGCVETAAGCALNPAETPLVLWVETARPVELFVDGAPLAVRSEPVEGGQRLTVDADALPGTVAVVDDARGVGWRLRVDRSRPVQPIADDDCDGIGAFAAPGSTASELRVHAACAWAAARADAQGEAHERLPGRLVRVAGGLERAGFRGEAQVLMHQAAFMHRAAGQASSAEEVAAELGSEQFASSRWLRRHIDAVLSQDRNDLRAADAALADAESLIRRAISNDRWAAATADLRATLAGQLGDLDAAVDAHLGALGRHPLGPSCDEVARSAAENVAWFELLRRRAGSPARPDLDPTALLARVGQARTQCGDDPGLIAATSVNQAFDAWSRGAWAEALGVLDPMDPPAQLDLRVWADALRASALYEQGEMAAADSAATSAVEAAMDGGSVDAAVFALLTAAEVSLSTARPAQAEAQLMRAQELLWDTLPDLPSHIDRSAFVGLRYRVTPRVVSLLARIQVDDGRPDEALRTVRLTRARALRSLRLAADLSHLPSGQRARFEAAREEFLASRLALAEAAARRWTLSAHALAAADQAHSELRQRTDRALGEALELLEANDDAPLRRPDPDEVLVLWIPVDERWLGLGRGPRGVFARPGPSIHMEGDELAAALVHSIADELSGAQRLTILPWGALHELDVHLAPHNGAPLLQAVEVVWSLDLPPRRPQQPGKIALVVGDPQSNLPNARREAEAVASRLDATLLAGDGAGVDAVLAALPDADRFHYAGHGMLDADDAFRSGLSMSDDVLDVGDLLSLPAAPRLVVLSGCETGRTNAHARVASIGIAQALILAGSDAVVASNRPVADAASVNRIAGLLDGADDPSGLIAALHEMQAAAASTSDPGAWRVWVP